MMTPNLSNLISAVLFSLPWLCGLAWSGVAAAEGSVAFVDIPAILEEAPQARAARARLEREFSGLRKELDDCAEEFDEVDGTLRREGRDMEKTRRDRMIERARTVRRKCSNLKEEFETDFNKRRREEMEVLQTRIFKVIESVAVKRDFKLIVGPPVIYADDRVDLTKEVLDVLSREGR